MCATRVSASVNAFTVCARVLRHRDIDRASSLNVCHKSLCLRPTTVALISTEKGIIPDPKTVSILFVKSFAWEIHAVSADSV